MVLATPLLDLSFLICKTRKSTYLKNLGQLVNTDKDITTGFDM